MSLVLNVEILGEFKKLTDATTGAEKALRTLQGKVSTISSRIAGGLAAIGISFGVGAVVNGIKESIDAASDQEQQFGALESIFGALAPRMKDFASNQNSIGLTTAGAARQMALLGSQLKGVGMPIDQVADKTESLIGLAADLAATYGGSTADAVDSISSLFRGEFDPIEKYGVAIKQSDINAKLAADGLDGLTGEALKTAKAQAALALLFSTTTDAQGQAAREADTYASKNAELKSKFGDLQAELGEKFLPIMVTLMESINDNWDAIEKLILKLGDLAKWIIEEGVPAFSTLIGWIVDNKDAALIAAGAVAGIGGAVKILKTVASVNAAPINASFLKMFGWTAIVITALETIKFLSDNLYADGGFQRVAGTPAANFSGQTDLKAPNASSFTNMAPSVKVPVVPTTTKERVGTQGSQVTINVNKGNVTADEIVKTINDKIKQTGGSLLLK